MLYSMWQPKVKITIAHTNNKAYPTNKQTNKISKMFFFLLKTIKHIQHMQIQHT